MKNLIKYYLLFVAFTHCAQAQDSSKYLGNKIVWFAEYHFGKKVDRGECWDLAAGALNYANASWKVPYEFGTKIELKKYDLLPGDILQFNKVKIKYPNTTIYFPLHTAIVYKARGKQITLIHQNYNNKKSVDTLSVDLNRLTQGKIQAYRPISK